MTVNLFQQPIAFVVASLFLFNSCKKSEDNPANRPLEPGKVTVEHISGFVTTKSGDVVESATVKIGGVTVSTDKYGYFELRNARVNESAATIHISKNGYFDMTKTFLPASGKKAFVRIMLLPKINIGTINAVAGGSVLYTPDNGPGTFNGMSIELSLPGNSVEVASSGVPYTGTIQVAANFPSIYEYVFYRMIPGDLRCADSTGHEKKIASHSVMFIALTGSGGEVLQIAKNKKATLIETLPSTLITTQPEIAWYFDEEAGFWKEGGEVIKTGLKYKAEISRTGCWNYNAVVFDNLVSFDCTIVDEDGHPIPSKMIAVASPSASNNYIYTDSSGYAKGIIPANTDVKLEVYRAERPQYSDIIFSKPITTSADLSLGNIVLNRDNTISLEGYIADCDNTNGQASEYIMAGNLPGLNKGDNYRFNIPPDGGGSFRFNMDYAGGTNFPLYLVAANSKTLKASQPVYIFGNPGKQTVPTINICDLSTLEYFNYTLDGTPYSYVSPTDSFIHYVDAGIANVKGWDYLSNTGMALGFDLGNMSVGSTHRIKWISFAPPGTSSPWTRDGEPSDVTITEYGDINGFISGSFNAIAHESDPSTVRYNILGNFRVRRKQ